MNDKTELTFQVKVTITSLEHEKRRNLWIIGCKKPKFTAEVIDQQCGTRFAKGLLGIDGFSMFEADWNLIKHLFNGITVTEI